MTDQRDSLAREIDEELRREQLLKLWERYGTYLVAAVVLIVAGIGGFRYYQYRQAVAAEKAGTQLAAAARDAANSKKAEARKIFEELTASGPGGYATLARLRLAAADRDAGKTAEAASAYEAIANARAADPLLADYAQLQAAVLRLDGAGFTEMQNRLNALTADGNAWRFSARELLGLAAHKAGNNDEARRQFQRLLADPNAPPGIAERARIMMAVLVEDELAKGPQATQPAPAPADGSNDKPAGKTGK